MKDPKAKSKALREAAVSVAPVAPVAPIPVKRDAEAIIGDAPEGGASKFRTFKLSSPVGIQKVTARYVPGYNVWVMPQGMAKVVQGVALHGWAEASTLLDSYALSAEVPDDYFYTLSDQQIRKYIFTIMGAQASRNPQTQLDRQLEYLVDTLSAAKVDSVHMVLFPTEKTTNYYNKGEYQVKEITARVIANAVQSARIDKFFNTPSGVLSLGINDWGWHYQHKAFSPRNTPSESYTTQLWATQILGSRRGLELGGYSVTYRHGSGYSIKALAEDVPNDTPSEVMPMLVVALVTSARSMRRFHQRTSALVVSKLCSEDTAYHYMVVQKNDQYAVSYMRRGRKTPVSTSNFTLKWCL